ncbi:MAG: gliding motility-associated C-terminal domain-containing protein [Bacteroidia bacterium]
MKKLKFIFLFFTLFTVVRADNIRWKRACLNDLDNVLNLEYASASDCDSILINIYGERSVGAGFRLIGQSESHGLASSSLDAENSSNWRLYLVLINKCTKDSVLSNIILVDNAAPENIGIDSVSVVGDSVVIGWKESTSDDLKNYVLYFDLQGGLSSVLDTVEKDKLFYYDNSDKVDVNSSSETFRIAAFDSCDISTGQVDAHSTIYLSASSIDFCDRNLNLNRTAYSGWDEEVDYYLIYRIEGTDIWKRWSDFEYFDKYADFSDLRENFELKVRAINSVTGFTSSSNSILIQFGDNRVLDLFYLHSVFFNGDSTIIEWVTNSTDLVNRFELQYREGDIGTWNIIRSIDANSFFKYSLTLKNSIAGRYYRLRAISDCGDDLGFSNIGRVIDLSIKLPELDDFNGDLEKSRVLNWMEFKNWKNDIDSYNVFRKIDGTWDLLSTVSDTFYIDSENLVDISVDSGICYKVVGFEGDRFIDTISGTASTTSKCVFFNFHNDLPNAFDITDDDQKFFTIPVENLDSVNSYILIYNRWGELVMNNGLEWNGGFLNNVAQPCPADTYFYVARIELKSGDYYFVSNSLNLFR